MQSTGMLIFWFVFIVAMIPLSLYMLKKSGLAKGRMGAGDAVLKTVSQLSLGPSQRIVTIELGAGDQKTWLVLGVTAQSITALHMLQPTQDSQEQAERQGAASTFPILLKRASDIAERPKV
ncbi:flagellar biosynthetic protein FliO [Aquabacterium sp.]|uniref:FliO/MopB family protein n=1 Tax=Aquabacterium sp. TaxID=1872578 RepID=UPI0019B0DB2E|nr:flagellar biosynthetic protein FliO [Aquabacterium sp.]MBC7699425.1 flagellar biosynthetic protein FliO [Aquabacterium sp.]